MKTRITGDIPLGLTYSQIRPFIQTGSCIMWKGRSTFAKLIRWKSDFTHASLCVRLGQYKKLADRVFLVEALSTGLELRLLSERINGYNGEAYFMNIDIPIEIQNKLREFALIQCSKNIPYDYRGLFANVFGRVVPEAKAYFCSEFVWRAWEVNGLVKKRDVVPRPDDLIEWAGSSLTHILKDEPELKNEKEKEPYERIPNLI